jgi:hypothetical protein
MLLDPPARVLYGRGVNLYVWMRLVSTPYCCIVRLATGVCALLLVKLLIDAGALHALVE